MQQVSFKVGRITHSNLKKLAMLNGDGRLGNYLTWVAEEHVRLNKDIIKEFDDLVKKDDEIDPIHFKSNNSGVEDFINEK